ncbi:MAG: hypothetical protein H6721_15130 [Sandaracinus sp.]|nr:hypothetical protein [Sandaracinus sp.]MCB9633447.1 hypothetical protein [Sandaracinus sp.]
MKDLGREVVVGVTRSSEGAPTTSFERTYPLERTSVGPVCFVPFEDLAWRRAELTPTDRVSMTLDWRADEALAALFVVLKRPELGAFADRRASLGLSVLSSDLEGSDGSEGLVATADPANLAEHTLRFEARPGRGFVQPMLPELARGDGFSVSQILRYVSSGLGQAGLEIDGDVFSALRRNGPRVWKLHLGFGPRADRPVEAWQEAARSRKVGASTRGTH